MQLISLPMKEGKFIYNISMYRFHSNQLKWVLGYNISRTFQIIILRGVLTMRKLMTIVSLMLAITLVGCSAGGNNGAGSTNQSASTSQGTSNSANQPASKDEKPKDVIVMKIAATSLKEESMSKAVYKFEEIVEAETDGAIDVEYYPEGQLGGERDILEGIQLGTIHGGTTGSPVLSNFSPRFGALAFPFLYKDRETSHKVLDGPIGKELLTDLDEIGIVGFNYWESGVRHLTNNVKEVRTPADLEGLKLRTMESQIQMDSWEALGASPTPMAFTELFTALQTGVVDGQENPYSIIALSHFNEVQKYLTQTSHVIAPNVFLVSKDFFNSLTSEQQEIMRKAADEARDYQRELYGIDEETHLKYLEEQGMVITSITPEERALWIEKIQPVYDQYKQEISGGLVDKLLEASK